MSRYVIVIILLLRIPATRLYKGQNLVRVGGGGGVTFVSTALVISGKLLRTLHMFSGA